MLIRTIGQIEERNWKKNAKNWSIVFHHDNARPHTSLKTRVKLRELDWDILPHPPYSPDLALSDYHRFRSLEHYLRGKNFQSEEHIKTSLLQFFAQREQKFFEKGILNLSERWEDVVRTNGQKKLTKKTAFRILFTINFGTRYDRTYRTT